MNGIKKWVDSGFACISFPAPIIFTVILTFFCNLSSYSQSSDPQRFWQWVKSDPVTLITDTNPRQWMSIASFGATLSVVSFNDGAISRNMQAHYRNSDLLDFTDQWGNWSLVTPIAAGIFGTSLLTNNIKFQDAAFTSLQSVILANVTVNTGKFLFARDRPGDDEDPHNIHFVTAGKTSFPSGHAATAFALITPWTIYYPGPLTYTMLAIPVGTSIARVAKGKHWLSDVGAGAAIGLSIGYYLSKKHLNIQSDHVEVVPSLRSNKFALTLNISF
jgi:membrane-associated phospholipid phosphatase